MLRELEKVEGSVKKCWQTIANSRSTPEEKEIPELASTSLIGKVRAIREVVWMLQLFF
jgi:hypothetical protein